MAPPNSTFTHEMGYQQANFLALLQKKKKTLASSSFLFEKKKRKKKKPPASEQGNSRPLCHSAVCICCQQISQIDHINQSSDRNLYKTAPCFVYAGRPLNKKFSPTLALESIPKKEKKRKTPPDTETHFSNRRFSSGFILINYYIFQNPFPPSEKFNDQPTISTPTTQNRAIMALPSCQLKPNQYPTVTPTLLTYKALGDEIRGK